MNFGKWPETVVEAENRLRSVEATSKCLQEEDQKRMPDNIVSKLQPEMEKMLQKISAVNSKVLQQPTTSPTMVEPLLDDRKVQHRTRTPRRQRRRNPCYRCVNDEVIPSRSEVIIPVQTVDKSIKSKLGATCLVQIRNNKTFLQVLNPTNAKVRLSKHTKIGKFSEIIENSISSEITDDTIEINSIDKGTQNKNNEAKYIEIAKSLNFNFSDSDLTTEQKQKLMVMLGTNRDVFAMNLSELGCTDLHPHRIETGDAQPVRQRFYRQSPAVKGEASKHVEEMLKYDIIEPSQSEWASPICLVQKKSPKSASSTPNTPQYRFCVDFRLLNTLTTKKVHPIVQMDDIVDMLGEAKAKFL
ncbi:unnamed protein product [Mytilus edulis]|uniref:Uncharacterized protein n=1 Tax=Mytilus edulis TaxID=6550 RepID=A0A8S3RCD0_MYTED|nr:unnamed protein product [Mytilus edulis]